MGPHGIEAANTRAIGAKARGAGVAAKGFQQALAAANIHAGTHVRHASAIAAAPHQRRVTHKLPDGPPDRMVAYEHRGIWYTEDTNGTITELQQQQPTPGAADVVADRLGLFQDPSGKFVYRTADGKVTSVDGYDPSQAGYFKLASGGWGYRNAWGNVATSGPDGKPIQPPRAGHVIEMDGTSARAARR